MLSLTVTLLIIAQMAREVPSALPSALAKNTDCELLYRTAPPKTAWQAASRSSMVNSRYQPTSTASALGLPLGATIWMPALRSGSFRPSPPSTSTLRWPVARKWSRRWWPG